MSRPLKVFSGMHCYAGKQHALFVAATSAKSAAELVTEATRQPMSVGYIRNYWTITGNKDQLKAALEKPGVVLRYKSDRWQENPEFVEVKR